MHHSSQPVSDPSRIRARCLEIANRANVRIRLYRHEPVLDYEAARRVRLRFDIPGRESKSLFLRTASGRHYMLVTLEGTRVNFKEVARLLGERTRVASADELSEHTGCVPSCACPLGLPDGIGLIIDEATLRCDSIIFSTGLPEETTYVSAPEWGRLLGAVRAEVKYYSNSERAQD